MRAWAPLRRSNHPTAIRAADQVADCGHGAKGKPTDIRTRDPTQIFPGCTSIDEYGRALMSTSESGRSTVSRIRSTSMVPPAM
jgi:hypothetical protein